MNWFRKFMIGRYGTDKLTFAMIIFSMLLSVLARSTHSYLISILSYILIILCFFRMFSKNTSKRYKENARFTKIWNPIQYWATSSFNSMKAPKTHRYYKCPNCSMKLRVPKNRGKINITCPKCHTQFVKKT